MPDHHDQRFTTANFFDNFTRNVKATELWRIYDKTDANSLRLFLSNIKEGTVLDFGCGDGRNIPLIVNHSHQFCVGMDISRVSIQQAKAKIGGINADLVVCDGTNLPFKNNAFETAVIVDVLHHNMNITYVMSEVWRVLALQGQIFVKDLTYTPLMPLGKKILHFAPKRILSLFSGITYNLDNHGRDPHGIDLLSNHLVDTIQNFGFHIMTISKSSFFVTVIDPFLQIDFLRFLTRSRGLAIAVFKLDEWLGNKLLSRYPRIVRISAMLKSKPSLLVYQ